MIIFRVLNGQSWRNARDSDDLMERISAAVRFAMSPSTGAIEGDAGSRPSVLEPEDINTLRFEISREDEK
jgi:hypothetical protein